MPYIKMVSPRWNTGTAYIKFTSPVFYMAEGLSNALYIM